MGRHKEDDQVHCIREVKPRKKLEANSAEG